MKKLALLLSFAASVAVCSAVDKAPKPPKGVYTVETYAEAKSKAISEKKLLVYMWSDLATTCPLCAAGTDSAMKAFKSNKDCVLVFGQGEHTNHAPPNLRGPLMEATKKAGNSIPVVMIVDPNTEKMLSSACYKQFAEDDRIWKKMQKEAAAAVTGKSDAEKKTP